MTELEEIMEPQNSKMLVRPDKRSRIVGSLEIPETVIDQVRAKSGTILKVGSEVKPWLMPGRRVLYQVQAATQIGVDEKGELDVLDDAEVLALTDGEEDGECDEDWIPHLIPPPKMLLVERDERPERISGIIVSDAYKNRTRSSRAIVRSSLHKDYPIGTWVSLSSGSTKSFTMDAMSTRLLTRIFPGQILCKIKRKTEHLVTAETSMGSLGQEFKAEMDQDPRWDAGDTRAPR